MGNDTKFYEQRLWEFHDRGVTQNTLVLSSFFTTDEWGISPTKLKLSINNYKNRKFNHVFLDHQKVFLFLSKFKAISDNIAQLKKDIKTNHNKKQTIELQAKKLLRLTTMYKMEYEVCQRLVISDGANDTYYDDEKIFVPNMEFFSLIKIMVDFRENYLSLANTAQSIIALGGMAEKLDTLNDKLSNLRNEIHSRIPEEVDVSIELADPTGSEPVKKEYIEKDYTGTKCADCGEDQWRCPSGITCDNGHGGAPPKNEDEEDSIEELDLDLDLEDNTEEQKDLEDFLEDPDFGENKPLIDTVVDRMDKTEVQKKSVIVQKTIGDCFTSTFLEGNILNLETYVSNLKSDKLPLHSFTTYLSRKLDVSREDLFPNCTDKEYWQMVYLTTKYSKFYLHKHLNEGKAFPVSVSPLRYKCEKSSKLNKTIMHDLLLYFVYYTHLKSQLQERDSNSSANKNVMCFMLKAVLSPYVFSHFESISTLDVLLSEIKNRYDHYTANGVFKKLNEQVHGKYGQDIVISKNIIAETIKKVHKSISTMKDRFWIDDFFKTRNADKIVKFDYEIFRQQDFGEEQITEILALESNYARSGSIDFGTLPFDKEKIMKLPQPILEAFDIQEKTYNKANLVRYIKDTMVENNYQKQALEIIENINESYHDLSDKHFEYVNLPEDVLKLLCIWDLRVDKKLSANYNYMKQKIEESSLDKTTALSMLSNIDEKQEISFTASLSTAT